MHTSVRVHIHGDFKLRLNKARSSQCWLHVMVNTADIYSCEQLATLQTQIMVSEHTDLLDSDGRPHFAEGMTMAQIS